MWPVIAAAGLWSGRLILETDTLIAKGVMHQEFLEAVDIFRHGFQCTVILWFMFLYSSIAQADAHIEFLLWSIVPFVF